MIRSELKTGVATFQGSRLEGVHCTTKLDVATRDLHNGRIPNATSLTVHNIQGHSGSSEMDPITIILT